MLFSTSSRVWTLNCTIYGITPGSAHRARRGLSSDNDPNDTWRTVKSAVE